MNDLLDELQPLDLFKAFQLGQQEAFRHFFGQHHYRMYCYLVRQTRDRQRSRELTRYCFVVLFRNHNLVKDEAHLLRILYMLARMSMVLQPREPDATAVLEDEWRARGQDDDGVMDDSSVISNETLLSIQRALQKLNRPQRELAELFFFQGMAIQAIARLLGVGEAVIREAISEILQQLGEGLAVGDELALLLRA